MNNFGFEQSVHFFKTHASDTYIDPEKADTDRELMLSLKHEGTDARKRFIAFSEEVSKNVGDLEYHLCSKWSRNNGRGKPTVITDGLWTQLRSPKWKDQIQSVSLGFGGSNRLEIWVDIVHRDKRLDEDPAFNQKILEQQFHLLDKPLKGHIKYRIREEDYREYCNDDVDAIKVKYGNAETKPLIQVVTNIDSLFEKDNDGRLIDEVVQTVKVIKSYYDFIMTHNVEDCVYKAEHIEDEINEFQLVGEDREAIIKLRVNQNEFRNRLLAKFDHCALCKVAQEDLLVASHIKPWSKSLDTEKLDPDNGLIMCPNHDRLFDRGFISFDDDGKILISSSLTKESCAAFGITDDIRISLSEKNKVYLQYHRNEIFRM